MSNLPVSFNKLYYTVGSSTNNEKIVFDDAVLKSTVTGKTKEASSSIDTKAFLIHKGTGAIFKPFVYAKSTNGVFNVYQKDGDIGVTYTSDADVTKNKSLTETDEGSVTYTNVIMNESGGAEFCSTVKVDKVTLDYNEETKSLDFIFN